MADASDAVLAPIPDEAGMTGGGSRAELPAAVGIEYVLDGKVQSAHISTPGSHGRAGSAVVVTAGALHTPKVRHLLVDFLACKIMRLGDTRWASV